MSKILSLLYILITEKASEIWIVNGRPSGMATTTNTTNKLMFNGNSSNIIPAVEESSFDPSSIYVVATMKVITIKITKITMQTIRL